MGVIVIKPKAGISRISLLNRYQRTQKTKIAFISMVLIVTLVFIMPAAIADTQTGVRVYADNFSVNGTTIPVNIGYAINDTGTGEVMLEIMSLDDTIIRRFECGDKGNGSYNVSWDGKDNNGTAVPAGNYTVMACYYPDSFTISGKWGSTGIGDGQFKRPSGIAVDKTGDVYVADYDNCQIQKFDPSGMFLLKWGGKGNENGEFNYPAGIAVGETGNTYVVDLGNSRVEMFTSDGEYLSQWGGEGSGPGRFDMPHGIAIDSDGNVYVADMGNSRIQKFTSTGKYLGEWGGIGRDNGSFICPVDVAVDDNNDVYVTDIDTNRVQEFTGDGKYIAGWGSTGSGPGQFKGADGIDIDGSGYVFVSDIDNHRIQKFSPDGTSAGSIELGGIGSVKDIAPAGIVVNGPDSVYVTDFSNDDVQSLTYDAGRENTVIQNETNFTLNAVMGISALDQIVTQQSTGAPVTTLNLTGTAGNNSWYRSNVTITLAASDKSGSGIRFTDYSFDNATWYQYNGPLNIGDEGTTTVYYYSADNQNNVEQIRSDNVRVDMTPPKVNGSATGKPVVKDWYTGTVTVHFVANDTLSGVISVTPDQTISTDGPDQSVTGIATDLAGNIGTTNVSLNIDNAYPQTTCLLSGMPGGNGWYKSDVQVNFSSSDGKGSGVKTTEYSLDGGNWNPASPFIITKEGITTVYYRSTDEVGNVEPVNTQVVMIDKSLPVISGHIYSPAPLVKGWYTDYVTVYFTATDAYSGVAGVTLPQNLTLDGAYQSVIGVATDNASNTASTVVGGINIDCHPPMTTCSLAGYGGGTGDNTWYRDDVTVTLAATDAGSGVNYTQYSFDLVNWTIYQHPFTVNETSKVYFYSTDNVGNKEFPEERDINIDRTPPVMSSMNLTKPNADGWYTDTAIIHFTATDDMSGVGSISPDIYLSSDGPNQTVTGYASDMAGNIASFTVSGFNIDINAPVTACTLNNTPEEDGWFRSNVQATLLSSDNSGTGSNATNYSFDGLTWYQYTKPLNITNEGINVLYYNSTDNVRHVEPINARNIKIDRSSPSIAYEIEGGTPVNGWYTQNVTVHFIASDLVSGIKSVTPDVILTKDGASQAVNGSATDKAGNGAFVLASGINIDKTTPSTHISLAGTLGNNGWYTTPVTVSLTATDGNGTGVNRTWYSLDNVTWSRGTSFTLSVNGLYTVYYYSTDNVSNTEAIKAQTIKIDLNGPEIHGNTLIGPTSNNWYNTSVTVHFSATDNMSGVAFVTPDQTLSDDGANQMVTGYATDNAGNIENFTAYGINIDKQTPDTTCYINGTNGTNGWYTSDVKITLATSDMDGAALTTRHSLDDKSWSISNPFYITSEGNTTVFYYTIDGANNTEAVKSVNLNIDKTAPTITCAVNGTMGTPDAYRSNVAVSFSASDSGNSGLLKAEYSMDGTSWTPINNFSLTNDGKYNIQYRAGDNAGNGASGTRTIIIDRSTPNVNYTDPQSYGEGAFVDDSIIARFTEPMDPATINNSTFTLAAADGTLVNGSIQYTQNGDQYGNVSFKPLNELDADTMYTAALSSGVRDIAGNTLADNYAWIFTTGDQARNGGNIVTIATPTPEPTPESTPLPTAAPAGLPIIGQLPSNILTILLAFLAIAVVGGAAMVYLFFIRK